MQKQKSLKSTISHHIHNLWWKPIIVVIMLTVAGGFAVRIFAQGPSATYFTGCLRPNSGTISDVAIGTQPSNPCQNNEISITWSNGDINKVLAGTGLIGGGESGEVFVEADTNYLQRRVSGDCPAGESIRVVNNDGSVVCQSDTGATYAAGAGLNLIGNQFGIANGGVAAEMLADDSVDDRNLNLAKSQIYFGPNTQITSTSPLGQTLLSFSNLEPGTYMIYGLAQAYVDQAADTHGGISFVVNDGATVVGRGPQFYFTEATGWQEQQAAGFMFVITLNQTTTLNLGAYKGPGALTTAVAGGGTNFGYIKIGE